MRADSFRQDSSTASAVTCRAAAATGLLNDTIRPVEEDTSTKVGCGRSPSPARTAFPESACGRSWRSWGGVSVSAAVTGSSRRRTVSARSEVAVHRRNAGARPAVSGRCGRRDRRRRPAGQRHRPVRCARPDTGRAGSGRRSRAASSAARNASALLGPGMCACAVPRPGGEQHRVWRRRPVEGGANGEDAVEDVGAVQVAARPGRRGCGRGGGRRRAGRRAGGMSSGGGRRRASRPGCRRCSGPDIRGRTGAGRRGGCRVRRAGRAGRCGCGRRCVPAAYAAGAGLVQGGMAGTVSAWAGADPGSVPVGLVGTVMRVGVSVKVDRFPAPRVGGAGGRLGRGWRR